MDLNIYVAEKLMEFERNRERSAPYKRIPKRPLRLREGMRGLLKRRLFASRKETDASAGGPVPCRCGELGSPACP